MRNLDPGPARRGDEDAAANWHWNRHRARQARREHVALRGGARCQQDARAVLADRGQQVAAQPVGLVEVAGHEHAAGGVAARQDVLVQGQREPVVLAQHVEVVEHHERTGRVIAEQGGQILLGRARVEHPEHARVVGPGGQRRAAGQHERRAGAVAQRGVQREGQGGRAPRAPRPGDEHAVADVLHLHRAHGQRVPADPQGQGAGPAGRAELQGVVRGDHQRQLVHARRPQGPRQGPPALARSLALPIEGGRLDGARGVLVQQRHVHLTGVGAGAEGAPRRHGRRHVACPHAHQVEAVGRRHAQQQPVLQQHARAAAEGGAVARDHHAHAHRRPLAHEGLHAVEHLAAVDVLEDGGEAVPAVQHEHQVGQPLPLRCGRALLGQGGVRLHGELLLAPGHLGAQHVQQAAHAVALVAGDDGARVRQGDQRQQRARAGVQAVEVDVGGRGRARDPRREGAQEGRAPRARGAGDAQVPSAGVVPGHRALGLLGRDVLHADCERGQEAGLDAGGAPPPAPWAGGPRASDGPRVSCGPWASGGPWASSGPWASGGPRASCGPAVVPLRAALSPACLAGLAGPAHLVERDELGQRLQPRAVRGGQPGRVAGLDHRVDQRGQIGGHRDVLLGHRPRRRRARQARQRQRLHARADGAHRPARAPAHAGGLELQEPSVAQARVGPPRDRGRDVGGGGGLDHVLGVALVGHAQGDAKVRVGLDLRRDHARGPLGRQHQVHAQGAAAPGDVHQAGDEVGQLGHQGGELVDDEHQARHGLVARPHARHVVLDVLGVGPGQLVLAAPQLGAQRLQGPGGQVPVEVGDHAHRVGQARAVLERRPALVVHQHERHRLGRVAHAQGGDERLQQLGLARPRRPRDQGVRTIRTHIQHEHTLSILTNDRGGRPPGTAPPGQDRAGVRLAQADDVQESGGARDRPLRPLGGHVAHGSEAARHPLGPARRRGVEHHLLDLVGVGLGDGGQRLVGHDDGPALLGQRDPVLVDAQEHDARGRARPQHLHHAGHQAQRAGAVEHDDGVRARRGVLLGALLDQRGQSVDLVGDRLLVQGGAHPRAGALGGPGVRQPARPLPLPADPLGDGRGDQHRDAELGGGVEDRALGHHPARRLAAPGPGDAGDAQAPEGHGDGHVRRGPPQRLLVGGALGNVQLDLAGHVRRADPQVEPVPVVHAPLPQARARAGGAQHDLRRIGVVPPAQPALLHQRLEGGPLGTELLLLVLGHRLTEHLLAVGAAGEAVGDHHDRGEHEEQQRRQPVGEEEHDPAHDDGRQEHGRREGLLAQVPGPARQREHGGPRGPGQPRRAVEVDGGRPGGRGDYGVGLGHRPDHELGGPHAQDRVGGPARGPLQTAAVQLDQQAPRIGVLLLVRGEHDLRRLAAPEAAALPTALPARAPPPTAPLPPPRGAAGRPVRLVVGAAAAEHEGTGQLPPAGGPQGGLQVPRPVQGLDAHARPRRHAYAHKGSLDAGQRDVAGGPADGVLAQAEAVDRTGPGPADQAQLDKAVGLLEARRRPAEVDERPVAHGALVQPCLRVQEGVPRPQVRGPLLGVGPRVLRDAGAARPPGPEGDDDARRGARLRGQPRGHRQPREPGSPRRPWERCAPGARRRGRSARGPRPRTARGVRAARGMQGLRAQALVERPGQVGDRRPLLHRDQHVLTRLGPLPGQRDGEQQIHVPLLSGPFKAGRAPQAGRRRVPRPRPGARSSTSAAVLGSTRRRSSAPEASRRASTRAASRSGPEAAARRRSSRHSRWSRSTTWSPTATARAAPSGS